VALEYFKWTGYLYGSLFRGSAPLAAVGCAVIGLVFGAVLFVVSRTSYAKILDERSRPAAPSAGDVIKVESHGDGNANVGKNSGTVTVNNGK
jgi:hypothetical protein